MFASWILRSMGFLFGLWAINVPALEADGTDSRKIEPGSGAFRALDFAPYEAHYTSRGSATTAFTLRARLIDGGKAINLIDIIPMAENVIVAQRRIHAKTHAVDFASGPLFSWGAEFVVQQVSNKQYDWVRIPIGGGEPIRMSGELENGPYTSDMFSPTLSALLPLEVGDAFQLPVSVPRADGFVSSWWEEYRVLRREPLATPSGEHCECWVLEKEAPGGGTTLLWIADRPPFVFKRHFDLGGKREFVSELLRYRELDL